MRSIILIILALATTVSAQQFKCPEPYGYFEDPEQCDLYWECVEGEATPQLCEDGLVFDPFLSYRRNPCDHQFNVDCSSRPALQTPQPRGKYCPRKYGYYAHPDLTICHRFFSCIDGVATEHACPVGTHFHQVYGTCVWPEISDREGCRLESYALANGFSCPKERLRDPYGQTVPHPKYPHPVDCSKFYICLDGLKPREQGCPEGSVFNDVNKQCDDPKNVPECVAYYDYEEDIEEKEN